MADINEKLEQIVELEKQLSKIKDVDILQERILTECRRIINADAGSIYEVIDNGASLKIKYGQNDTRQKLMEPGMKLPYTSFTFPISETSILPTGISPIFPSITKTFEFTTIERTIQNIPTS